MKIKNVIFVIFMMLAFGSSGVIAGTAGKFQWPVSPVSAYEPEGFHTIFYDDPSLLGYHMGEDWNAKDGSDETGNRLNALTNGKVIYVGTKTGKGNVVIVRYTLPDGNTVDGAYYHCNKIVVSLNSVVTPGQKIAEIGKTGTSGSHLHWQMQTDPNLSINTNPYHGKALDDGTARDPMTPANALRYTSPSLFVDDRSRVEAKYIPSNTLATFTVNDYAPSSTAFFEFPNITGGFSIKRAVEDGRIWEHGVVWKNPDGKWECFSDDNGGCDVMKVRFEPGVTYATVFNNSYTTSATFNLMPPGHNFKDDRARIDMMRIANEDSRYNNPVSAKNNVRTELFASYNTSDSTYFFRKMAFMFKKSDGTEGGAYFYHATLKTNPLIRYVYEYIIDTGTWTWVMMNSNSLY